MGELAGEVSDGVISIQSKSHRNLIKLKEMIHSFPPAYSKQSIGLKCKLAELHEVNNKTPWHAAFQTICPSRRCFRHIALAGGVSYNLSCQAMFFNKVVPASELQTINPGRRCLKQFVLAGRVSNHFSQQAWSQTSCFGQKRFKQLVPPSGVSQKLPQQAEFHTIRPSRRRFK